MHKVFLALGSNVGNREQYIQSAIELLQEYLSDVTVAKFYETRPVGYIHQRNFLNTSLSGYTDFSPKQLLELVKQLEKKIGRVKRFRWGPREIDIDILFYDNLVYKDQNLEIPHPRLHERDFVLQPLLDLDPTLIHPVSGKTVQEMHDRLSQENRSVLQTI